MGNDALNINTSQIHAVMTESKEYNMPAQLGFGESPTSSKQMPPGGKSAHAKLGPNAPADKQVFERRKGGGLLAANTMSDEELEAFKAGEVPKSWEKKKKLNLAFIERENKRYQDTFGATDVNERMKED